MTCAHELVVETSQKRVFAILVKQNQLIWHGFLSFWPHLDQNMVQTQFGRSFSDWELVLNIPIGIVFICDWEVLFRSGYTQWGIVQIQLGEVFGATSFTWTCRSPGPLPGSRGDPLEHQTALLKTYAALNKYLSFCFYCAFFPL